MRRFEALNVWLGGGALVLLGGIAVAAAPPTTAADVPGARATELVELVTTGEVAEEAVKAEGGSIAGLEDSEARAAEAGALAADDRSGHAAEAVLETQVGSASYYANMLAGRPTASGIPYDPSAAVAAHQELPFGTRLRVHNLANGRVVEVEVVDRGPFAKGRILDLSRSAAEELDFIRAGHTRVRIEVLEYGDGRRR